MQRTRFEITVPKGSTGSWEPGINKPEKRMSAGSIRCHILRRNKLRRFPSAMTPEQVPHHCRDFRRAGCYRHTQLPEPGDL